IHEIEPFLQVDAINNELRIAAVALTFAIHRDDVLVVVDRALRPDTADHAQSFHRFRLHFLIKQHSLRSRSKNKKSFLQLRSALHHSLYTHSTPRRACPAYTEHTTPMNN